MKKKMKKLLSWMLITILTVCLMNGLSIDMLIVKAEQYSGTCGKNVVWNFDTQTGELSIVGRGDMTNYGIVGSAETPWYPYREEITSVYISDQVTGIGKIAFSNCNKITEITIPDSVTSIRDSAFNNCTSLEEITIPDSVTDISYALFAGCTGLTEITIPDSVTTISMNAFNGCSNLESINLSSGLKSIGTQAFSDCEKLSQINLPYGLETIGSGAFSGCNGLTEITIPDSVTTIQGHPFQQCENLETVYLSGSLTKIESGMFSGCKKLNNIIIPQGITRIEGSAFSGCESLLNIIIPGSVTSIGSYAFSDCTNLTNVDIKEGLKSIGTSAFQSCSSLSTVNLPDSLTSIGSYAFCWCTSLTSLVIPEGVTSIGSSAFVTCQNLVNINIPENITSLEYGTFSGCSSLNNVTIPENITKIGGYAFFGCSSLTEVVIPENVTSIGYFAFYDCKNLSSINIPDNVNSIGEAAFEHCNNLSGSISIPEGIKEIPSGLFDGCSSLTEIVLPESITSIGGSAFDGCSSLTHINIPERVTSIGSSAFDGCSSLSDSITVPEGVTAIGQFTFRGCENLSEISLPSTITSIGYSSFEGCSNITSINLPEGLTSIGGRAFFECNGLTKLEFPDSLETIGEVAFRSCNGVTSVEIPENVKSIGRRAFYDCAYEMYIYSYSCEIYDSDDAIDSNTILYGYKGSTTEQYAKKYNRAFIPFGDEPNVGTVGELTSISKNGWKYCVTSTDSIQYLGGTIWDDTPTFFVTKTSGSERDFIVQTPECSAKGTGKHTITVENTEIGDTASSYIEVYKSDGTLLGATQPKAVTNGAVTTYTIDVDLELNDKIYVQFVEDNASAGTKAIELNIVPEWTAVPGSAVSYTNYMGGYITVGNCSLRDKDSYEYAYTMPEGRIVYYDGAMSYKGTGETYKDLIVRIDEPANSTASLDVQYDYSFTTRPTSKSTVPYNGLYYYSIKYTSTKAGYATLQVGSYSSQSVCHEVHVGENVLTGTVNLSSSAPSPYNLINGMTISFMPYSNEDNAGLPAGTEIQFTDISLTEYFTDVTTQSSLEDWDTVGEWKLYADNHYGAMSYKGSGTPYSDLVLKVNEYSGGSGNQKPLEARTEFELDSNSIYNYEIQYTFEPGCELSHGNLGYQLISGNASVLTSSSSSLSNGTKTIKGVITTGEDGKVSAVFNPEVYYTAGSMINISSISFIKYEEVWKFAGMGPSSVISRDISQFSYSDYYIGSSYYNFGARTSLLVEPNTEYTCSFTFTANKPKAIYMPDTFVEKTQRNWTLNDNGTYSYKYIGTYSSGNSTECNVSMYLGYLDSNVYNDGWISVGLPYDTYYEPGDRGTFTVSDFSLISSDELENSYESVSSDWNVVGVWDLYAANASWASDAAMSYQGIGKTYDDMKLRVDKSPKTYENRLGLQANLYLGNDIENGGQYDYTIRYTSTKAGSVVFKLGGQEFIEQVSVGENTFSGTTKMKGSTLSFYPYGIGEAEIEFTEVSFEKNEQNLAELEEEDENSIVKGKSWTAWTNRGGAEYTLSDHSTGYKTYNIYNWSIWWANQTWIKNVTFEPDTEYTCAFTFTGKKPKAFRVDQKSDANPDLFTEVMPQSWTQNKDGTYSYKYVGTFKNGAYSKTCGVRISFGKFTDGVDPSHVGVATDTDYIAEGYNYYMVSGFKIVPSDKYVDEDAEEEGTLAAPKKVAAYNFYAKNAGYQLTFKPVDNAVAYRVYMDKSFVLTTFGEEDCDDLGDGILSKKLNAGLFSAYADGDVHVLYLQAVDAMGNVSKKVATKVCVTKKTDTSKDPTDVTRIYVVSNVDKSSIEKASKSPASITIISGDDKINDVSEYGTIKLRGNSTSKADKKAYNIAFNSKQRVMVNAEKGKKWCLLANAYEKSLIRNKLAMDFGKIVGGIAVPEEHYADLYLNGVYMGNFVLSEPADNGRAGVSYVEGSKKKPSNDIGFELENIVDGENLQTAVKDESADGVAYYQTSRYQMRFATEDLEDEVVEICKSGIATGWYSISNKLKQENTVFAKMAETLDNFETALSKTSSNDYQNYIDEDSFISMYIVNELFQTVDFGFSSVKFYITYKNDVPTIHAGPLWDFDLSSGNSFFEEARDYNRFRCQVKNKWFRMLMQNPTFKNKVIERFAELQPEIQNLYKDNILGISKIAQNYNMVQKSRIRNYSSKESGGAGWSETEPDREDLEAFYGYSYCRLADFKFTYDEHINYLKQWLKNRNEWLCQQWEIDYSSYDEENAIGDYHAGIIGEWDSIGQDGWKYCAKKYGSNGKTVTDTLYYSGGTEASDGPTFNLTKKGSSESDFIVQTPIYRTPSDGKYYIMMSVWDKYKTDITAFNVYKIIGNKKRIIYTDNTRSTVSAEDMTYTYSVNLAQGDIIYVEYIQSHASEGAKKFDFNVVKASNTVSGQPGTGTEPIPDDEVLNNIIRIDRAVVASLEDGETYTLPTDAEYGYVCGDDLYKPGTTIVATDDMNLYSVNNISMSMKRGAAIKTEEVAGIAFQTEIAASDELLHSDSISTGMLVTLDDLREENGYGALDKDSEYYVADISNEGWFDRDLGVYRAGVKGVGETDYVRDFVARGYVQLTYTDGTTSEPIYSEISDSRNITQVAQAIIDDGKANDFVMSLVDTTP